MAPKVHIELAERRGRRSTLDDADEHRTLHMLMKIPVHTVAPSDPLKRAIHLMFEQNIGSVVVVEEMRPVGIFTERDLVRVVAKDLVLIDRSVEASMTKPVITIDHHESPTRGLIRMAENKIAHLPIVDEGKLVGITTQRDLVRWFMKNPAVLLGL